MQDFSPATAYQQQLQQLNLLLSTQKQKRRHLGWLRFIVFALTIIASYQVFVYAGLYGWLAIAMGLGILLFLVSLDIDNNTNIKNTETLIHINEEELKILQHYFYHRFDGNQYSAPIHDYANDLDIFGKASLYQWANRCFTEQGRDLLANNLLEPLPVQQVEERHEAIKEISSLLQWRQQLQSYAIQTAITNDTERKATTWIKEKEKHFVHPAWKIVVWVYTIVTLASLAATILGYLPASTFSTLFFLYFIISITLSRNTIKPYVLLGGIVKEISTLQSLVKCVEHQSFQSHLLNRLKADAKGNASSAAEEIKELKSILDRFDMRLNIAGLLFFNSFLLWDVRQMIALNEWRKRNREHLSKWFSMIAEIEVLNSLATIHFNQPEWTFPKFSNEHLTLNGSDIGHPLIPESTRVNNDFELTGIAKIGLITGSNMAGKSTFLRSLGVNIVLAQTGSVVCARYFELSPVHLMSSMRIADNLAENTSTFYAELKKLKTIIESVNNHEQIFILLDEILRGTNSLDRHTGSAALIRQMIKQEAIAVIATHDVELAKLEQEYPASIENYHFDVQVEGEELYFDYKLKQGICTSLNASILMKKIGIELS